MQASHLYDLSPGSGLPFLVLLTGTDKEQRVKGDRKQHTGILLLNIPWLSSQSYGFSSHVRMWELDYEENWVLKN